MQSRAKRVHLCLSEIEKSLYLCFEKKKLAMPPNNNISGNTPFNTLMGTPVIAVIHILMNLLVQFKAIGTRDSDIRILFDSPPGTFLITF